MSKQAERQFQTTLWNYYNRHGRHALPWRLPATDGSFDPYRIMVSEVMLQQTQVARVIPKYLEFLKRFPNVTALADASLGHVLTAWSGLGYNRRAKFLWQAAHMVQAEYQGVFPSTLEALVRLPGVGTNTAGAIVAYAYNQPVIFIETNIRTAYIHHFFQDRQGVADREILALVTQTLAVDQPREFYWALMDYGSHLKATIGNLNSASKTYSKQSTFAGSQRQIRGHVIRLLTLGARSWQELADETNDERLDAVLADLLAEQLIQKTDTDYRLS